MKERKSQYEILDFRTAIETIKSSDKKLETAMLYIVNTIFIDLYGTKKIAATIFLDKYFLKESMTKEETRGFNAARDTIRRERYSVIAIKYHKKVAEGDLCSKNKEFTAGWIRACNYYLREYGKREHGLS